MIVKVIVELEIECARADDAGEAVDRALDYGIIQKEIEEHAPVERTVAVKTAECWVREGRS